MPPDVLHFRPLSSPQVHFSQDNNHPSSIHKHCQGTTTKVMNLTKKKLIPILVLFLSIISVLRLLGLTVKTSLFSYSANGISPLSQSPQHSFCSHCNKASSSPPSHSRGKSPSNITTTMTAKEFKVLYDLIALKSPCNLLIFGFQPQYLVLSSMNSAGTTIFLEDDIDKISNLRTNSNNTKNSTQIYQVEYNVPAKSAYKLLKHARKNPACAPNYPTLLPKSKCKLALKNLPSQVYEKNWDVMVVDGPVSDSPDSPGRMAPIYTASVLARARNSSSASSVADVVVHDVDRTIEKWFSWEFLCDENLLYSRGKLWHFRIKGNSNSTRFCHS